MKTVTIETAANGYIARELGPPPTPGMMREESDPHVFETFDSLTGWLREHIAFTSPAEPVAAGDTLALKHTSGAVHHLERQQFDAMADGGLLWEFYPDAPKTWPNTEVSNPAP